MQVVWKTVDSNSIQPEPLKLWKALIDVTSAVFMWPSLLIQATSSAPHTYSTRSDESAIQSNVVVDFLWFLQWLFTNLCAQTINWLSDPLIVFSVNERQAKSNQVKEGQPLSYKPRPLFPFFLSFFFFQFWGFIEHQKSIFTAHLSKSWVSQKSFFSKLLTLSTHAPFQLYCTWLRLEKKFERIFCWILS